MCQTQKVSPLSLDFEPIPQLLHDPHPSKTSQKDPVAQMGGDSSESCAQRDRLSQFFPLYYSYAIPERSAQVTRRFGTSTGCHSLLTALDSVPVPKISPVDKPSPALARCVSCWKGVQYSSFRFVSVIAYETPSPKRSEALAVLAVA